MKESNSKLYYSDYNEELINGGKISKEDVFKRYLFLNSKAIDKVKEKYFEEAMKEKEIKEANNIYKSFKKKNSLNPKNLKRKNNLNNNGSVGNNKTKGDNERKGDKPKISKTLLSFISKYNVWQREDSEEVKKNNQSKIINLNDGIKDLNHIINIKKQKISDSIRHKDF